MKLFKTIYRVITRRKVKPIRHNSNTFSVNKSLQNAIEDLKCYGYVEVRHVGDNLLDKTAEALKWCDKNCTDSYFYTIDYFTKTDTDYIREVKQNKSELMVIFAFSSRDDYYSFDLFFN